GLQPELAPEPLEVLDRRLHAQRRARGDRRAPTTALIEIDDADVRLEQRAHRPLEVVRVVAGAPVQIDNGRRRGRARHAIPERRAVFGLQALATEGLETSPGRFAATNGGRAAAAEQQDNPRRAPHSRAAYYGSTMMTPSMLSSPTPQNTLQWNSNR